jgi:hypothetical protein
MNVALNPHRPSPSQSFDPTIAEPDALAFRPAQDREAPDAGDLNREAPETRVVRQKEAPDAGEGRVGILEHEFTHGRSQS